MIKARPTVYGGIHFRSRLEATWAAFFDQLGWSWEYEHEEIAGWLPDFTIRDAAGCQFLIEVKPRIEILPGSWLTKKMEKGAEHGNAVMASAPKDGSFDGYTFGTFIGYSFPCAWGYPEWDGCYLCKIASGFALGSLIERLYCDDECGKTEPVLYEHARPMWGAAKKATRYEP